MKILVPNLCKQVKKKKKAWDLAWRRSLQLCAFCSVYPAGSQGIKFEAEFLEFPVSCKEAVFAS